MHTREEALGLLGMAGLVCSSRTSVFILIKHTVWTLKKVAAPTVLSPKTCFNGNGSNVPSCNKTDRQTDRNPMETKDTGVCVYTLLMESRAL